MGLGLDWQIGNGFKLGCQIGTIWTGIGFAPDWQCIDTGLAMH